MQGLALLVQEGLGRDPLAGDVFVFRGRGGSLIKALWHDGIGLSLYAKRLDRGRFVLPVTMGGVVGAIRSIRGGRRTPDRLRKNGVRLQKKPSQIAAFVIPSWLWMTTLNRCQMMSTH
jgi:transposase